MSIPCIFNEIFELEQCEECHIKVITVIVITIAVFELGIFFILINSADKEGSNKRSEGKSVHVENCCAVRPTGWASLTLGQW